jgi:hypothetical protein
MFEATTLFAFYHERAHIRQLKSEILKENAQQYLTERYAENIHDRPYDRKAHAMEFDADIDAASLCAEHLWQYVEQLPEDLRGQVIGLLLGIGVAGILVYWLRLCNGQNELYYERGDHPHALIRSYYVVDAMLKHRGRSHIPTAQQTVLNLVLEIVFALYQNVADNPIQGFTDALECHGDEIEQFVNNLIAICRDYPELLLNQHLRKKRSVCLPRGSFGIQGWRIERPTSS